MTTLTPEALRQLAGIMDIAIDVFTKRHQGDLVGVAEYFRLELLSEAARQEKDRADRLDAAKQGAANPFVFTGSGQASTPATHSAASVAGAVDLSDIKSRVHQGGGYLSGTLMNEGTRIAASRDVPWLIAALETLDKRCRIAEAKATNSLANNLCPDHRDKQAGQRCLACQLEEARRAISDGGEGGV